MSERLHGLAQLLPEKTSLEDCSLEELQHLTKRFPFFAPAQFLLLQKLKDTGSPDFENQHRKAVLYFHDPLLFDYLISPGKFFMDEAVPGTAERTGLRQQEYKDEAVSKFITTPETEASEAFTQGDNKQPSPLAQPGEHTTVSNLPPPPPAQTLLTEIPQLTEPDKIEESDGIEAAEPTVLQVAPLNENLQKTSTAEQPEEAAQGPETAALIPAPPTAVVPVQEEEPLLNGMGAQKIEKKVQAAATETQREQPPPSDEPLLFEPYHTVDYFASQGIKITTDALPKDKLSTQLRSFTEWLKVMKRLPAAEMEAAPQSSAEKTVENMATHSVEGGEVVTEAMAEVWARQGNNRKAIETYNKLSLQNPSKKAYFATKIENLSGT